ncbi:MAG: ribonuclease III [Rickettsiales bacterium]|nr:ribonuclease III [Rickettsiales bacterium]
MTNSLKKFCQKINYNFSDEALLEEAITHPSLSKENNNKKNYQRLEFLGDKVLSLTIGDFLMKKYENEAEGDLSKRQAALVSGETLSEIALEIGLNEIIKISKGEQNLGGATNKRNLENSLEALIGAIYLDGGYESATNFIMRFWREHLNRDYNPPKDPVSSLQELIQLQSKQLPEYKIEKCGGSDHAPQFRAILRISGIDEEFSAIGKSKKEAQKEVAKITLNFLTKN